MPTYEYGCDACGFTFEREQRITEDPLKKCPNCGKMKLRRLITGGTGFILKGGGWYSDLYHKGPDKGDSGDAGDSDTSSDASDSASESSEATESKPKDKKDAGSDSKKAKKQPSKKKKATKATKAS